MNLERTRLALAALAALAALLLAPASWAVVDVQCPGDTDGDAVIDSSANILGRQVRCEHTVAGDGYTVMSDGRPQYIFGFGNSTGVPAADVLTSKQLKMEWPGPTMAIDEGDEFYWTLTNVGFVVRPDLVDPHTIHFHGFPQASNIYDGLPQSGVSINMGASLTYYYNVTQPGTYLYHCHVEAVEHMHMGMLANLWVRPAQNRFPDGAVLGAHTHSNPDYDARDPMLDDPLVGDKYAYNDGDGSTLYDVEYPIMLGGFDPDFHDADETTQPLPFATLEDSYTMINGRGYPDTVRTTPLLNQEGFEAQKMHSLIRATQGQKVLLRIINLNITEFWTVSVTGIPMQVIAYDAELLRDPQGVNRYRTVNSVTLGGGEAADVIIDTAGVPQGTYALYTNNLNLLASPTQEFGGLMTELVVE